MKYLKLCLFCLLIYSPLSWAAYFDHAPQVQTLRYYQVLDRLRLDPSVQFLMSRMDEIRSRLADNFASEKELLEDELSQVQIQLTAYIYVSLGSKFVKATEHLASEDIIKLVLSMMQNPAEQSALRCVAQFKDGALYPQTEEELVWLKRHRNDLNRY